MIGGWLRRLDVRRTTTILLFLLIFGLAVRVPLDTDTWWHLRSGRVMLEEGRILQTDLFSHTRYGSRWINHSWLSQIILTWLFERFGHAGLGVWVCTMVTATFVLIYLQMAGDPYSRAFVLVLAAATSAAIWTPRPQLFSFLLTGVVTYLLHLFKRRGVNRLWLLPPLFVLWVNLHAGYALGFMVLAAFVAGEVFDLLLARWLPPQGRLVGWRGLGWVVGMAVLSALLLVVNPNTTRMWTYYLDTVRIQSLRTYIQEWRSPDFHLLFLHPFIWLLLATLGTMGLSGRRVDGTDLALVALFVYATLLAVRNVGPFTLVAAPALSRHLTPILDRFGWTARLRRPQRTSPLRVGLHLVLLLAVAAVVGVRAFTVFRPATVERAIQVNFPAEAVDWILEHRPAGEMFNPYNWGGYLIWSLWPDYRVFVDGRTDLYGDAFLEAYRKVTAARPEAEEILERHHINLILIESDSPLITYLSCTGRWEEVYRDEMAVVLVRR